MNDDDGSPVKETLGKIGPFRLIVMFLYIVITTIAMIASVSGGGGFAVSCLQFMFFMEMSKLIVDKIWPEPKLSGPD